MVCLQPQLCRYPAPPPAVGSLASLRKVSHTHGFNSHLPSCSSNQISSWTFRPGNAKLTWMVLPPSLYLPSHPRQSSHSIVGHLQFLPESASLPGLLPACACARLAHPFPAQGQAAARFKASLKPLHVECTSLGVQVRVLGWESVSTHHTQ